MKKIVIIGGGFAGLSALAAIRRADKNVDIALIDKKQTSDFLPLLPDTIGRGISPQRLVTDLSSVCRRLRCVFMNEDVTAIDIEKKTIQASRQGIAYDYLIIASGTETNFYGNTAVQEYAYTLDSAADAKKIISALRRNAYDTAVISGGGYTGIEVATNLRRYCQKKGRSMRILIVEKAPALLGPLPEWMRSYAVANLKLMGIEVVTGCQLEHVEKATLTLSTKEVLNNVLLIWTAGVKTADFVFALNAQKTPQGRVTVDEYLRIRDDCFIVGDCSSVIDKQKPLRMAVQFSLAQGAAAGYNLISSMRNKPLRPYAPVDLGYIIPMANNYSCGSVMGLDVQGRLSTLLHYCMCIFRSRGIRNQSRVLTDLLRNVVKS